MRSHNVPQLLLVPRIERGAARGTAHDYLMGFVMIFVTNCTRMDRNGPVRVTACGTIALRNCDPNSPAAMRSIHVVVLRLCDHKPVVMWKLLVPWGHFWCVYMHSTRHSWLCRTSEEPGKVSKFASQPAPSLRDICQHGASQQYLASTVALPIPLEFWRPIGLARYRFGHSALLKDNTSRPRKHKPIRTFNSVFCTPFSV
jgi:hypothetical protein